MDFFNNPIIHLSILIPIVIELYKGIFVLYFLHKGGYV